MRRIFQYTNNVQRKEIVSAENTDQRRWRTKMLLLNGSMLAAPPALLLVQAQFHFDRLGICLFKSALGVDCPACGITRSVIAMLTGDHWQAVRYHPAGPLIVAIIAFITLYLALVLFTGYKGVEWRKEAKAYTRLEMLAIAALVIGWTAKLFFD
jgi:hypothetical protein